MRTKSGADIGPDPTPSSSVIQALLGELTANELERVAEAVIREYRCRVQTAQALFEEIARREAVDVQDEDTDCLQHDYRIAVLSQHTQHQLVSLVVNHLGHVPDVDGQRPILN